MKQNPPVETSIEIDATPSRVWALVSDLTRMGDWSPECRGVKWKRGASGPVVGARFKGRNRRGPRRWSTDGVIVAATPEQELTWDNSVMGLRSGRWSYHIEALPAGGSRVTESWRYDGGKVLTVVGRLVTGVADRPSHNEAGMRATLARLKEAAEARV